MECTDPNAPVTGLLGFVYEPESALDPFFQLPLAFQPTTGSQYEKPVGSGKMVPFPQTNFTEPQGAHAIQVPAGNKVFTAYSDLTAPLSALSNMDPKAKTMNPFGMKPFGFNWVANTPVLKGEVCTPGSPLTGNGHTYQAQNSGTTGAAAPAFPTTEGGTVNDNGIVWKEKTMVIANRIPNPPSPTLAVASGGSISNNTDVYVIITVNNPVGESLSSTPVKVTTTAGSQKVNVTVPAFAALPGWVQNLGTAYQPTGVTIYAAEVTHGSPAPAYSSYAQSTYVNVAFGGTYAINTPGGGPPPTRNSARVTPGQLPTPTTAPDIQQAPTGLTVNPPNPPVLSQIAGSSAGTAGEIFDFALTLINPNGETTLGGIGQLVLAANGNDIQVTVASSYGPTVTHVNVYVLVTPGNVWTLVNASPITLGTLYTVSHVLAGGSPPSTNTATVANGSFPAGRDVYVAYTYTNGTGETPLGIANSIINTSANDAVQVNVSVPLGPDNEALFVIDTVGVYEADVPTGTGAPSPSQYSLVGYFSAGATPFILESATGPNPPTTNTTGTAGNIAANTATGGANGTQGYRYAAMGWINQMETFSGFTLASVVSTIIDEDGWELGIFNILTGMPNVVGRYVAFVVADGSQAGPFNWIGLVNLQVPSQNNVYPQQTLIDQVNQSATVFLDNVTTQGIVNFTDDFLTKENNVDDRLDIAIPPIGCRVDYLESVDRLAITGVPGLASGAWISLGGDYESFYADNSPVPIASGGDICYGVSDAYKGIPYALMQSGGFTLSPNTGNPNSWKANRRWGGIKPEEQLGPCGFRAWAACGKFIIFAHRSGLYKYDESDPDMMSKEIPKLWDTINWAAGSTISVTIDEDTHTVIVLVPTGDSTVPDQKFVLSYIEGWNNPIHFSTYSGKEISMDAARRWSPHDGAFFLCVRMNRTIPPGGNLFIDGPTFETLPESATQVSQLLFASSTPDGTVQMRTPGIFSDNGGYIDYQYETMSSGLMQAVCKPEGFNLNASGQGTLIASFIASREQVTDTGGEEQLIEQLEEVMCEPIALSPKQLSGITRRVPPTVNEFWRVRFVGNKQPGDWVSLKAMTTYMIALTGGRDSGDR